MKVFEAKEISCSISRYKNHNTFRMTFKYVGVKYVVRTLDVLDSHIRMLKLEGFIITNERELQRAIINLRRVVFNNCFVKVK